MAWSSNYLTEAEAAAYMPEPVGNVTTAKQQSAITAAEAEVDAYLRTRGFTGTLPLTTEITTAFEMGVAKWVAAVLYRQHSQPEKETEMLADAKSRIDAFMGSHDLSISSQVSAPEVVNYQDKWVSDWAEPNDTVEDMDE